MDGDAGAEKLSGVSSRGEMQRKQQAVVLFFSPGKTTSLGAGKLRHFVRQIESSGSHPAPEEADYTSAQAGGAF
jgi:hypothetical protein